MNIKGRRDSSGAPVEKDKQDNPAFLRSLGVYGYDKVELVVLAALVTEDPLLLIGSSGTGKTYLLNSLSEALGLVHRHYNASLISFDDLVGFPYPDDDRKTIRFLETPATVWPAESVLVDEISRCKPEHQNRLFSLVHERRIQGISIEKLRYRWAAMNPADLDQSPGIDNYSGSIPLDQALADRFAFVLDVPDWRDLDDADRKAIADPCGEGIVSEDKLGIKNAVATARCRFERELKTRQPDIITYASSAASCLGESGIRISPRRVRQIARNLIAAKSVRGGLVREEDFRMVLTWSIPHRAWGRHVTEETIAAAHRLAWDSAFLAGSEAWLRQLYVEPRLSSKIAKILQECPDSDTGTLAVTQTLRCCSPEQRAVFTLALYPVSLETDIKVGREGINELARLAQPILQVDGEISWQERLAEKDTSHPGLVRYSEVIRKQKGRRRERACQLFYHLLTGKIEVENPVALEKELNACILEVSSWLKSRAA